MRHYEIVKVKKDGSLEISEDYAQDLGIVEGSYFLIGVDPDLNEANLERIALPGKDLVEIEIVVDDVPGVLSKISGVLGKYNVNILFSESEGIGGTNKAAIVTIVDVGSSSISIEELNDKLLEHEKVEEVNLNDLD